MVHPKLTLERTFQASIHDVWELWTTKEGIESWWGPEGFRVVVRDLTLRPGGKLSYAMSATGPEQIDFVRKAGMPVTTENSVTFTEVEPPRRLVYKELADFIPGVAPYEVETIVSLTEVADGVRLLLTFEAMHDDHWTEMARLGRESELDRLAKLLAARS